MAVSKAEGGLSLMSCVRENSPPDPPDPPPDSNAPANLPPHESKKRRFHPLRGLRRIFRRRRGRGSALPHPHPETSSADELSDPPTTADTTDEAAADPARRVLPCGLSLSHDSVFSPEKRQDSLDTSSTLSVQRLTGVQAELVDAVRRRRGREENTSDEDLGLPRSPASASPSAHDLLDKVLKENVNKSSHSTGSGSLLSMISSEMDEDSYGLSSGRGSKLSLHEKKSVESTEGELEVTSAPLNHKHARDKMAIKPKRKHGAPRKRRSTQLGEVTPLPATPEVNEDATSVTLNRSASPELPLPELTGVSSAQLKSLSLPPGTAPSYAASSVKLSRSRSSAADKQLDEQDEADAKKDESTSFFGRLLSRRSGKKKKTVEEPLEIPQKRMDEKGRYTHEMQKLNKHHPASRQRVEPINLSQERSVSRMQVFYPPSPTPPDSPLMDHKESESQEEKSPLRKVIPLEVDASIPKRTFIKKSQSFRRDECLPFMSLDTPSLPVGLVIDLRDEVEDVNELTTLEVLDQHLTSEKIETQKETTTVTVNISKEADYCEVLEKECVTDSNLQLDFENSTSLNCSVDSTIKVESSESVPHQITIPVNLNTVNIAHSISDASSSLPPSSVTPESRKSLKEGGKDEFNFYPIPAPRPSKQKEKGIEEKSKVPEFLRVQLNHVEGKPSVNVVLSTTGGSNSEEKISAIIEDDVGMVSDTPKDRQEKFISEEKQPVETADVKVELRTEIKDIKEDIHDKLSSCVAKDPIDPNQIKFINSVKQWSSPYSMNTSPNYSIVAIAPKFSEVSKPLEKPTILINQSVQKTVVIREVKEKSPPLVDNRQESSPIKVVLRQRSFVSDDKPTNLLNADKFSKVEDPKSTPNRKSLTKELCISDFDKARKLSLEKLDSRNQENMADFKRKSRNISSSDDNIVDRNSYGSSDTLASQDSGEVVFRRKSMSRDVTKQKEEEPELLKVFARRSLKVKDSDIPDLESLNYPPMKSRDSDKENDSGDSPPEERKKIKDHQTETKVLEKIVPSVTYKYQRSVSVSNDESLVTNILAASKKDNNSYEKRQRSRTMPDPKIVDPPVKVLATVLKEKEVEVINLEMSVEKSTEKEENVPKFKRIQQRKEEWEKRAQLAMKK